MKRFSLIAILVFGGFASAQAFCDEEDIRSVADHGRIIVLLDGSVWKSLDPATSLTWLSSETVVLCDDEKMINKDENGETIDVVKLH